MSNSEGRFDRLLNWIVRGSSPLEVLATAGIVYAGAGLALPLLLNWPWPWLVGANLVAVSLGLLLLTAWLAVQLQAKDRRLLLDWSSDFRLLNAQEFEWLVGEVFRREGWEVRERGGTGTPDGNIDLELARGSERRLVQCKRWESWLVGVDEIRMFMGTLSREHMPASSGVFVTLSRFTPQAVAEAIMAGLSLIDGADLAARLEKVRRTEPCPACGRPMLLGHSAHGWWLRCVAPGCSGKRHLHNDPGRAVALLTDQL